MRKIESPDKFFDLMDSLKGGGIITIGYVTGANLNIPKIKRKNPATNRIKGYPDYSVFNSDDNNEIGALIQITSYNFNYRNRQSIKDEYYNNIVPKTNDIRQSVGLEPIKHKTSYKDIMDYGEKGVEIYGGEKENLKGHTYFPQNMYKPHNISSTIYLVDTNGNIIRGLSKDEVKPYLKSKDINGVSALRKMGKDEETIQNYIKQLEDLKFSYKNFEADSILYIVATVNGEKLIYINENLKRAVDDININPADFLAIAREKYKKDLIQYAINENIINKLKNGYQKFNKFLDDEEQLALNSDNPAYLDIDTDEIKNYVKNGVKKFGDKLKNGYQKFNQFMDDEEQKTLNADNPAYLDVDTNEIKNYVKNGVKNFGNKLKNTFNKNISEDKSQKIINLSENDLKFMIKESVKKILKENFIDQYGEDWQTHYENDLKKRENILKQRNENFKQFESDPKIQKLSKMGFKSYIGDVFYAYDGDVSNVNFKELLNYVKHLRSMQNEPYNDENDYNNTIKNPTLQSVYRGEMMDGER